MNELINNIPLQVKEYKGQRVVTFKDIDMVHNRPEGTARKRFYDNRERFIEGEDFFLVKSADIQKSEIRTFGFEVPNRGLILLTENGYLMLVKSLTDDLSWDVQRQLVNTYFRAKAINNSYAELLELLRNDLKSDMEETVNRALDKKLKDIVEISNRKIENTVNRALDKKFKAFTKASDRKLRILAKALNRKIRTIAKASDKNSERIIIKTVSENTLSMVPYFDTIDNIVGMLCNKLIIHDEVKRSRRKK